MHAAPDVGIGGSWEERRGSMTGGADLQRKRRLLKSGLHLAGPKLAEVATAPVAAAMALRGRQRRKALRHLRSAAGAVADLIAEALRQGADTIPVILTQLSTNNERERKRREGVNARPSVVCFPACPCTPPSQSPADGSTGRGGRPPPSVPPYLHHLQRILLAARAAARLLPRCGAPRAAVLHQQVARAHGLRVLPLAAAVLVAAVPRAPLLACSPGRQGAVLKSG